MSKLEITLFHDEKDVLTPSTVIYRHGFRDEDETPLEHLERVLDIYPSLRRYLKLGSYLTVREFEGGSMWDWSRCFIFIGEQFNVLIEPGNSITITPEKLVITK